MNRRRDPRFQLHLPIRFARRTLTGKGFALNLSREGCLLETDTGLIEGDYLEVSLTLPGIGPPLCIQSAAVRWVRGRVCGLQFLYMDAGEDKRVAQVLEGVGLTGEGGGMPTPEGVPGSAADRRKFTRFTVEFEGSFSSSKTLGGYGIVRELCQRGCRVASDTAVPERVELEATIHLDVGHDPVQIELAVVRWSKGNEFGLEFIVAESETSARLGQFLAGLSTSSLGHKNRSST